MTVASLVPLLPILILAAGSLVILLIIAAKRVLLPVYVATLVGGVAALASLFLSTGSVPVTPLLVIDDPARFFTALLLGGLLLVTVFSYRYVRALEGNREEFYLLLLLATLGAIVLAASTHFASLFLGMEVLSVSLYGLVAYPAKRASATEGGIKYLFAATLGSTIMLFGMALLYAELGTMELGAAVFASAPRGGALYAVGMSMFLIGFTLKLALVPFHMWVADVYHGAPAPATAAIASISKAAMLAVLYRYLVQMRALDSAVVASVVLGIAIASMLVGSWLTLLQQNVKRLLAYSSIAQVGYLLIPLFAYTEQGKTALYYGLAAYYLATVGAFSLVTALSSPDREADTFDDFRGLARRRPAVAALFTLLLLSLAGIPLTMGFTGKLYLFVAAAGSEQWLLAVMLLIASGIGLFYYLRLVLVFFEADKEPAAGTAPPLPPGRISAPEGVAFVVLSAALVALGVYPAPILGLIQSLLPA